MKKLKFTKETIYHDTKEYEDFKLKMGIGKEKEIMEKVEQTEGFVRWIT